MVLEIALKKKKILEWFKFSTDPILSSSLVFQLGQDYFPCTLKKDLPFALFLTYHAFKGREGIVSQTNLLSDLRLDNFGLKQEINAC